MFSISKHYKKYYILSGTLFLASVLSLIIFGLKPGIDFTGGSIFELKFEQPVTNTRAAEVLQSLGLSDVTVQPSDQNVLIIKTESIDTQEERDAIYAGIRDQIGNFEEIQSDFIGPVIGQELARKAKWQTLIVILGILLFVAYAFRNIGQRKSNKVISSWRLSWAAIAALIHDIVILLGVFSVLGRIQSLEIDTMFITAILTTLGFSVNDTIVVFDRLRENMEKEKGVHLSEVIDKSVIQTMTRSLNTSFTLLFVLLALIFFGGESISHFVLAMIIGITVGTYSSIFIASPLLLSWSKEE